MNVTPTVQVTELIWTVFALLGMGAWTLNCVAAFRRYRALRMLRAERRARLWSAFSAVFAIGLIYVELAYVTVGLAAMMLPPNPESSTGSQLLFVVMLTSASAVITAGAVGWRYVDSELLRAAEGHRDTQNEH